MSRNLMLFLLMTVIWGSTWIAIKAGISAAPPLLFGAARFVLVALGLFLTVRGIRAAFRPPWLVRTVLTGLLVNVATYGLIFWGMRAVPSGVSGLTNLVFVAIGLYGFAVLFGQERPTWRFGLALLCGIAGLGILFADKVAVPGSAAELAGVGAIVLGTLAYCLGTVLARPLTEALAPVQITAAHAAVGAIGFGAMTLAFEPTTFSSLTALLRPAPLASLLFLVVCGTFVAYTIYLRLVRDWGAPQAGLYAFTSPVIALLLGAAVFGEPLGVREALGAAVMLAAAVFVLRDRTR